jgi:toxin FitB
VNWLLDTNVVSEWVKPRPDARVARWLAEAEEDSVYLSVITFAELRQGIEQMDRGARRQALETWLDIDLRDRFEGRILGVDLAIANAWGSLVTQSRRIGVNLGVMDAFFAATAQAHGLTIVTRNTKHFAHLGIAVVNPWNSAG